MTTNRTIRAEYCSPVVEAIVLATEHGFSVSDITGDIENAEIKDLGEF